MADWFADDAMWRAFAPALFTEDRLERTPAEVDRVVSLLGLEQGARVLDMCCGPGRHSLELARRGYRVTGVDITSEYLEQARASAQSEDLDVEFVHGDAREFRRPRAFDAVISMYASFGYFDTVAEDQRQLEWAHRSLRSRGAVLIDSFGKEATSRVLTPRSWHRAGEDLMLMENVVLGAWERLALRWILVHPEGRIERAELRIRLYSAVELAALSRQAGFRSIDVFGDLDGGAYDHTATRMVAVIRK